MKLTTWIKNSKVKKVDLADSLGITYRALYNYMKGRRPNLTIARKIVKLSGGQVSYEELAK